MGRVTSGPLRIFLLLVLLAAVDHSSAQGIIGVNWGTIASQPLPAKTVVQLLKDNNFTKVKLFDSNKDVLTALQGTGFEVMVAAPNDMLQTLQDADKARDWVKYNISYWRQSSRRVNITYAAIGNEPFLQGYNGTYVPLVLPALQNVQQAINEQKLQGVVKVVVPMNADVMTAPQGPSQTVFKPEYATLMNAIVGLLKQYDSPFIVNLYPYLSLYQDQNFPVNFAFFEGTGNPLIDGANSYSNVLEASIDSVGYSLAAANAPDMPIVLGEVGWPTDGEKSANIEYARRFNQGLLNFMMTRKGTPKFPNTFFDFYLFGLLDEDAKSVAPGNFERHWGVFDYAGQQKYPLDLSGRGLNYSLVPARNVKYLPTSWCIARQGAENDPKFQGNLEYACQRADCTPLEGSCSQLTPAGKASFAFNSYYQANRHADGSCNFDGLATTTKTDPAKTYGPSCNFQIEVDTSSSPPRNSSHQEKRPASSSSPGPSQVEMNLATAVGSYGAAACTAAVLCLLMHFLVHGSA